MAVYGAFADDSGSHAQSPVMILAGLVASHETWKLFSDEWYAALQTKREIEYFRSNEAESLKKCFEGFSRDEADQKIDLLTGILIKHISYGMLTLIRWPDFTQMVQAVVPRRKERLHNHFKHPFYLCFQDITRQILQEQVRRKHSEEIDFAFDKQGKFLTRSIALFDSMKPDLPEPIRAIAGQIIPGDDKVLLPIQAADLVAWQTRNRPSAQAGRSTKSWERILESKKIIFHLFSPSELVDFATSFDF